MRWAGSLAPSLPRVKFNRFFYKFVKRSSIFFITLSFFLYQFFSPFISTVFAISSPWAQTNWSGGSGQTNWSDVTKFSSSSNVFTSTANQVTLAQDVGTGADGAITISSTKTIDTDIIAAGRTSADAVNFNIATTISSGATMVNLGAAPTGLAVNDEIIIINLRGTSSTYSGVGQYETRQITAINTNTLTLSSALSNTYDGTTQKIMVQRVPNYTNVTIQSGGTLTVSSYSNSGGKGGVLFFRASGTVTVSSGGTIDASGKGYAGGAGGASSTGGSGGMTYNGIGGTGGNWSCTNGTSGQGGGGGGGGNVACTGGAGTIGGAGGGGGSTGGGGSGGGYGTVGLEGFNNSGSASGTSGANGGSNNTSGGAGGGGGSYGTASLSILYFGSGGGGGGGNNNPGGASGGAGGGIVAFSAATVSISGNIYSNGSTPSAPSSGGGGGGGAGGSILVKGDSLTLGTTLITASGGTHSGTGTTAGGDGGVGIVAIYSPNSVSGTTSPMYGTASADYFFSGTLTSSIFDAGQGSDWKTLTYVATTPANTALTIKVRTGNASDLSDATTFSSCTAISSGSTVGGTTCATNTQRYVQYQLSLTNTDWVSTPTFTSFSLAFAASDSAPPALTLTTPSSPTQNTEPVVTGTAIDSNDTVANVQFQMDSTAGSWSNCTATDGDFNTATEVFTCTPTTVLADGVHIMYVRSTDSNGNTTTNANAASTSFTIDTTPPVSLALDSPGDNSYTNSDRPTFRWKVTSDATSGVNRYKLVFDNGGTSFTVDGIPTSGTSDISNSRYTIHFDGFNQSDVTQQYISVTTKSSTDWDSNSNDGKPKEGKRTWTVTATDNAGNSSSSSRTLFEDKTAPSITMTQINTTPFTSSFYTTADNQPMLYGTVTDPLGVDSSTTNASTASIASGPTSVQVELDKKNLTGTYDTYSITTVNLAAIYFSANGSQITDNSLNTSNKQSPFAYKPSVALPIGTYRVSITGKDSVGNSGSPVVFTLTIGSLNPIAFGNIRQQIQQKIEQEFPQVTQQEQTQKELQVVLPTAQPKPSIVEQIGQKFQQIAYFINRASNQVLRTIGTTLSEAGDSFNHMLASLSNDLHQPQILSPFRAIGLFLHDQGVKFTSIAEILFDTSPTIISDVKVAQVGRDSAVITWKTNHLATSKVNYGFTYDYGQDIQSTQRVRDHRVIITNLKPGTRYHYEVMSVGKNYVFDARHDFTTLP